MSSREPGDGSKWDVEKLELGRLGERLRSFESQSLAAVDDLFFKLLNGSLAIFSYQGL